MDVRMRAGDENRLAQECRLTLVLLDKVDFDTECDRKDQAGESSTGTQVDCARWQRSGNGRELQAVLDMAWPEMRQIGRADQVDCGVPLAQQINVSVEHRCHGMASPV